MICEVMTDVGAIVLVVVPFVIMTTAPERKFVPLTVNGRAALLTPESGVKPDMVGLVAVSWTKKAPVFTTDDPSVLRMVRLYLPAGAPARGKVQRIRAVVRFVMVPVSVEVLLIRETDIPFRNPVPAMVTATLVELYPEMGVMEVIAGEVLVTVKAFERNPDLPSGFIINSEYVLVGAPERGKVHLRRVSVWDVMVPGMIYPELFSITEAIVVKLVPVTLTGRETVFSEIAGEMPWIIIDCTLIIFPWAVLFCAPELHAKSLAV